MRVNQDQPTPAAPRVPQRRTAANPHGQGRIVESNARLAKIMRERGIRVHDVGRVLLCSDRTVYNYLRRRSPIPALRLGQLCDRLDMDPAELVDDNGFLRAEEA